MVTTENICVGNPNKLASMLDREYLDLKKYIFWVLATLLPYTMITIAIGALSNSLTIFCIALDSGASLVLHTFNMVSIIMILRQNRFSFPYGTGKLENFSGFLYAIIIIPMTLVIINSALDRYLHPPATIDLGLAQVSPVLGAIRACVLLVWISTLCKRYPDYSPMTQSYYVNLKLTLIRNFSMVVGLLFGIWMLSLGHFKAALAVDLIIGVSVSLYMLYCASRLLVRNFRSLIDLPLPEADQYRILNTLIAEFDAYEGVGNLYSQLSGSLRCIQIELYFNEKTTVQEIENLRESLEQRLREHFSKLEFHLIPLIRKNSPVWHSPTTIVAG